MQATLSDFPLNGHKAGASGRKHGATREASNFGALLPPCHADRLTLKLRPSNTYGMGARISANVDSHRTLLVASMPRVHSAPSVPRECPQVMVRAASFPQVRKTFTVAPTSCPMRPASAPPLWQPSRSGTLVSLLVLSLACCWLGQSVEAAHAHSGHGVANLVSLLAGLCALICMPLFRGSADGDDAD